MTFGMQTKFAVPHTGLPVVVVVVAYKVTVQWPFKL